jgi:hypothetical protein
MARPVVESATSAELVGDGLEFDGDLAANEDIGPQQLFKLRDLGLQVIALGLELDARELREAAQAQLEDVLGLDLVEIEHLAQARAGLFARLR